MFESIGNILKLKFFWITVVFIMFYLYLKRVVFSYWKRYGVPHEDPTVPFGTFGKEFFLTDITFGEFIGKCYEKFSNYPYHGVYMGHKPVLMINDPDLIKRILVKDFANFCDRGLYSNEKVDPLSRHLFAMTGDKWRILRAKLSHKFNSGKLKQMFPYFIKIADEMIEVCNENLMESDIFDIKDLISRYTTDTIFTFAFGFNGHTLKNPNSQLRHYGDLSIKSSPFRNILGFTAPSVLDTLHIPLLDSETTAFFIKLFKDMVNKRRMENENKKDFLDLLIELMDHEEILDTEAIHLSVTNGNIEENIKRKLGVLEANAQFFVFFVAGFGMSTSVVTHCLYELALNPDVQEKLHEEIDKFSQIPNGFNYENIGQMKYLDMVFYETMRKHPSVPFLNRISINDYDIPNSNFCIPKDMLIIISASGIHNNPKIYSDPDKFDPTRFNEENTAARHPYSYLAFGEGPRICIGKRFGILQSKIALLTLLSNYKFSICEKTTTPHEYMLSSTFQMPKNMYLRVEKRNQ